MSSKTKIVVLHMKEVVYTAVFLALALILLVVFLIMFSGKKDSAKKHLHDLPRRPNLRCAGQC